MFPIVNIKPRRPERYGHPWIYDNEIASVPDAEVQDGDIVDVVDHNGKSLGIGYYNSKSKLTARLLGAPATILVDHAFWRERFKAALKYRNNFYKPLPPMYRLVHGESDGLPGLIVDRYGDWLVIQILALGIERHRNVIIKALVEVIKPKGIYERSDSPTRTLEGLELVTGVVYGEAPPAQLLIEDASCEVIIDIPTGGKTGLFLDQRENQIAASRFATGRNVLNCFSYTGLFGLRAAKAGARSVTEVESSAQFNAVNEAQWQENNINAKIGHELIEDNAFDILRRFEANNSKFHMVILDPPAFTKSRGQREGAFRGYNDINRRAMKLVEPGGVLVTCSCSHHVDAEEFRAVVHQASKDCGRPLRLIEQRGQPADHPISLSVPESEYLKCLIFEVG